MSVQILVDATVKPESVNEFKSYFKEILPDTRVFKGCLGVQLHINQDEPTNMILVHEWETREDAEKFAAWRVETGRKARTDPMQAAPSNIRYFDKTDA